MEAFEAARLHCSRATICRYVGGKAQIRDAVVMRMSARIIDTVHHAVDGLSGPERVVAAITVALEQIRADPIRRLMLDSTVAADLGDLHSSPILGRLAADLTVDGPPGAERRGISLIRARGHKMLGRGRCHSE
ncbi:TetR/AcrR family transcriptional regulator [Mycobacterium gastri]|uniref:TetR/AcrR family transcriptional regulator n=1 Tax=Mycobacterium gastri TaxID=1777 RepID=UPI00111C6BE3|nr:hypothetical protein [Mycobacterium gastri]